MRLCNDDLHIIRAKEPANITYFVSGMLNRGIWRLVTEVPTAVSQASAGTKCLDIVICVIWCRTQ
jgi:hypothetical protein